MSQDGIASLSGGGPICTVVMSSTHDQPPKISPSVILSDRIEPPQHIQTPTFYVRIFFHLKSFWVWSRTRALLIVIHFISIKQCLRLLPPFTCSHFSLKKPTQLVFNTRIRCCLGARPILDVFLLINRAYFSVDLGLYCVNSPLC